MDGLSKFEKQFGIPRSKWTKADWRKVAETLAKIPNTSKKKPGRPKLTEREEYEKRENLKAAKFWRDQLRQESSVEIGNGVYEVTPRQRKLTRGEATKHVVKLAVERNNENPLRADKLAKKAKALTRSIQKNEKDAKLIKGS